MKLKNKGWIPALLLCSSLGLSACGGGGGSAAEEPAIPGDGPADGGGAGGGGSAEPLVPVADGYGWLGNTRLQVFGPTGLLANDPAGAVLASADSSTLLGGAVSVELATGAFIYDPPAGRQDTEDSFRYRLAGGLEAVVSIALADRIWYVRNNDEGGESLGTDRSPFLTLAEAEAASEPGETIFVFAGARTSLGMDRGIALKPGQKLMGEGVGLTINGIPVIGSLPFPVLTNAALGAGAGNSPVVTLSTGNEVAGFIIEPAFNEGILVPGGSGHRIRDNRLQNFALQGREGIRLLAVTGENAVTDNRIVGALRDGIKLSNLENQAGDGVPATDVTGSVLINLNTIQNSAQSGISVRLGGTAATRMKLDILTNNLSDSGTSGLFEGIDLDSSGAAQVSAVVSRNSVRTSSDEAMEMTSADASTIRALVANGALSDSGGLSDGLFTSAAVGAVEGFCLELINNSNATLSTGFRVENNAGGAVIFGFFEDLNDSQANTAGNFTPVAEGGCNVVLNGPGLFESNCAICHRGNGMGRGNLGPDITNQTLDRLNFALENIFNMEDIRLTDPERQAIIDALQAP